MLITIKETVDEFIALRSKGGRRITPRAGSASMLKKTLAFAISIAAALAPLSAAAADYRGMPVGWPNAAGSYYTGYAPASYAAPAAVYAPRPVTVAYANPAYL